MILSRIKTYGLAIVAVAASALAVIAKLLWSQNNRLRLRAENAEVKARRAVIIMEADNDIEKAKEKIRENQKLNDHSGFNDPGKLWSDKNDS